MPPPDPLTGAELVAALAPLIAQLIAIKGELTAIRGAIAAPAPQTGGIPIPKSRPLGSGRL